MPTQEELDALAQQYPGLKKYKATSGGNIEKKTGGGGEKAFKRMMQNKKQGGNDDFLGTDKHQTEMLDLDNKNGHPLGDFGGSNAEDAAMAEKWKGQEGLSGFDGEPEDPNRFRTSAYDVEAAKRRGALDEEGRFKESELGDDQGPPDGDSAIEKKGGNEAIMRDQQHFGEKFAARQLSPESMDTSGFEGTTSQRSEKPPVSRKQARQDRRQARRNRRAQRRAGRK